MNQKEFIDRFAEVSGRTKTESKEIVLMFQDLLADALMSGEKVNLYGFGLFETHEIEAQKKFNINTGEYFTSKPRLTVRFKAGDTLLHGINNPDE